MQGVMIVLLLFAGFILSVGATAFFIPILQSFALQKGWVDKPDEERKLHATPVPTIGGLGIAIGFFVGLSYLALIQGYLPFEISLPPGMLWIGGLMMVGVGFYDDIQGLDFKQKFLLQLIAAYLLLHAGYRFDMSSLPMVAGDEYQHALYSIPLTLLWIVGIINAVNLLDGMDGLAAGVAMIGFICLGSIFGLHGELSLVMLALLICGALIGFLMYNFNPASIFMGDSGSLFLGFMLAAYTLEDPIHTDPVLAILIPVVALGLPVLDTNLSILRRLLNGKAICGPDHDHIHHRLADRWSHRHTVVILYAVAASFGGMAILMAVVSSALAMVLFGMTLMAVFICVQTLDPLRVGSPLYRVELRQRQHKPNGASVMPVTSGPGEERPGYVLSEAEDDLILRTPQKKV